MVAGSQRNTDSSKKGLRDVLRARRSLIATRERETRSLSASKRLLAWLTAHGFSQVGIFAGVRDEIQTEILYRLAKEATFSIALPRVVAGKDVLEFAFAQEWESLVGGCYGILEPVGNSVSIAELGAIVVPGLGFDANGGRLGYGAGWYDRTLSDYDGIVIGFGFDVQVVDHVPMEAHDRRLDYVVTDERLLTVEIR